MIASGCVANAEPEVSTKSSSLAQVNTSVAWIPGKGCGPVLCDGDAIWPPDQGITNVQVLYRSGPDRANHAQPTFIAFVVWNRTTVGRIFRVDIGENGADFRAKLSNIEARRTYGIPDTEAGSNGTPIGGPVPVPHPNVEGELTYTDPFLATVKNHAAAIADASHAFIMSPDAAGTGITVPAAGGH